MQKIGVIDTGGHEKYYCRFNITDPAIEAVFDRMVAAKKKIFAYYVELKRLHAMHIKDIQSPQTPGIEINTFSSKEEPTMTKHSYIRIEIEDGAVEAVLDRLSAAQEEIRDCYSELTNLGAVTVTPKKIEAPDAPDAPDA